MGGTVTVSRECPDVAKRNTGWRTHDTDVRFSSGANVRLDKGEGDFVYLDFVAYRVSSAGAQVWRWQVNRTNHDALPRRPITKRHQNMPGEEFFRLFQG